MKAPRKRPRRDPHTAFTGILVEFSDAGIPLDDPEVRARERKRRLGSRGRSPKKQPPKATD